MVYSFVVTYILGTILDKTVGFRVSQESEATGLDETAHLETAYEFGSAWSCRRARSATGGRRQWGAAASEEGVNA